MDALPQTLAPALAQPLALALPLAACLPRAMLNLFHIGLANAAAAGVLALLLLPAARLLRRLRRPAAAHALALLVLVKLITPAAVVLPVGLPGKLPAVWPAALPAHDPAPKAPLAELAAPPLPVPEGLRVGSIVTPVPIGAGVGEEPPGAASPLPSPLPLPSPALAPANAPTVAPAEATGATESARSAGVMKSIGAFLPNWALLAGSLWAAGSVTCAWVVVGRLRALRRLLRLATPAPPGVQEEADALARRLGLGAAPPVWFLPGGVTPMLLGVFARPRVLVPVGLWHRLDRPQRHTLLMHELAHLRRRDHWVRYVELLTTVLYWWHPAAWWARSALREAEEQCCDAWVVWALPGASRTYMATLLEAVDFLSDRPGDLDLSGSDLSGADLSGAAPSAAAFPAIAATQVLASGMGQFHCLQRRLNMVREQNVQRRLTGAALAAVLTAAAALPLAPALVRAQQKPEKCDASSVAPGAAQNVSQKVAQNAAPEATSDAADPRDTAPPDVAKPDSAKADELKAVDAKVSEARARESEENEAREREARANGKAGADRADANKAGTAKVDAGNVDTGKTGKAGRSAFKMMHGLLLNVSGAEAARAEAERARAEEAEARAAAEQRAKSESMAQAYAKEADALKMKVQLLQAQLEASRAELERYRVLMEKRPGAQPLNALPKPPAAMSNTAPGAPAGGAGSAYDAKLPQPSPKIALRYTTGRLEAIDSDSGKIVWVYQTTPEARLLLGGSPEARLLLGGREGTILLRGPGQELVVLDPNTGRVLRQQNDGQTIIGQQANGLTGNVQSGIIRKDGDVARDRLSELEARVDKLSHAVEQLANIVRQQGQAGQQSQQGQQGQAGRQRQGLPPGALQRQ